MAAVGGSVESVTINGREFPMAADADITRKIGGYMNEVQPNGDGSSRIIKTRESPALSGCVVECDDVRGDHEFLQEIADANEFFPIAITYANGDVYQGSGIVSGELTQSSQAATAGFDLIGTGSFTRQ